MPRHHSQTSRFSIKFSYIKLLLIALSGCWSTAPTFASTLMNNAEYHITVSQLDTFAGNAIKVRLCADCDSQSLTMTSNTILQEYGEMIDLTRASELWLRKQPKTIFIGIDRAAGSVDYINFGGHASDEY